MSKTNYVPERGDIVYVNFGPSAGHEQAKRRPALILSPHAFNDQIGLALVVPITSRVRDHGFEVAVNGNPTTGVILCHQVKTIDFVARSVSFIEKADAGVLKSSLAKVRLLVQ